MKKILSPLVVVLFVVVATVCTQAQTAPDQTAVGGAPVAAMSAVPVTANIVPSSATQAVVNSLASLPEADTLIYINPQRILNEVLPKFLPAKDIEDMRKGFEEVRKTAGVDPTRIEYVVLAIRFKRPTTDLNFQAPEFMMVSSGDFSADSLLAMARMASQGKLRDETYGTKTIGIMTIEPIARESEKNPLLKSFSEMGIVALNPNTIAAGSPEYLKAAIDAGDGKDRISTAALNSLVRDPNALVSLAGSPWQSFAKSFGMLGTEGNPRAARCESKMGDFYAKLTMDATNFMIRGVSNADNPDTAKILANLYASLLRYATSSIPDAAAQSMLKGLAITAEGDEVMLRADFPQQMVIDMIHEQMKPKQMEATAEKPATRKPRRRRSRRRH